MLYLLYTILTAPLVTKKNLAYTMQSTSETSRPKNLLETNEPIGRNFGPRYPIGSQEIWHRNSNRSSGSSEAYFIFI